MRALAEHAGIPVSPTFMGKGAVDDRSPLSLPAVSLQTRDSITAGLDEADVVIAAGYDLVELGPGAWNGDRRKRIVHIDSTPAEVDDSYVPEVEFVGDIGDCLAALRDELPSGEVPAHTARLRVAVTTELSAPIARAGIVAPQAAIGAIRTALGPDDVLISDVGAHKLWLGRLFHRLRAEHRDYLERLRHDGHRPTRRDRGFLMNVQEMETAVRLGVAVVAVVWVDGAFGVIGWKPERRFGQRFSVELGDPHFARLASSFGWLHRHAEDAAGLCTALEELLGAGEPALLTVPIDNGQNVMLAAFGEPALGA